MNWHPESPLEDASASRAAAGAGLSVDASSSGGVRHLASSLDVDGSPWRRRSLHCVIAAGALTAAVGAASGGRFVLSMVLLVIAFAEAIWRG